jgi:hypothetical protein
MMQINWLFQFLTSPLPPTAIFYFTLSTPATPKDRFTSLISSVIAVFAVNIRTSELNYGIEIIIPLALSKAFQIPDMRPSNIFHFL